MAEQPNLPAKLSEVLSEMKDTLAAMKPEPNLTAAAENMAKEWSKLRPDIFHAIGRAFVGPHFPKINPGVCDQCGHLADHRKDMDGVSFFCGPCVDKDKEFDQ